MQVKNTGNCSSFRVANYYILIIGLEINPLCVELPVPKLVSGQLVCEILALMWLGTFLEKLTAQVGGEKTVPAVALPFPRPATRVLKFKP